MKAAVALAALGLLACGTDEPPVFPTTYASSYTEVRGCRHSLEHDLVNIRVLAAPDALTPYTDRATPFPAGAVVLKEQYADDDTACAGPIDTFTVMQKLAAGSSPSTLDWEWQKVDNKRNVVDIDRTRCVRCHTTCGVPPDGYDGTCTVP